MALEGRERRLQLVGGVGDEPLLLVGGVLGPLEQPVECVGQPAELVGAALGDAAVERVAGDVVDLLAHAVDGPQRPAARNAPRSAAATRMPMPTATSVRSSVSSVEATCGS